MHSSKASGTSNVLGTPIRLSAGYLGGMTPKSYLCNSASTTSQLCSRGKTNERKTGPKIAEKLKRKLSFGARILQEGGSGNIYRRSFRVQETEKLLKVCQCYLSTTAGPIAGFFFVSTHKIAFCSERSIKITSSNGDFVRVLYKVSIPLGKIKRISQQSTADVKRKSQKYVEIVTIDDFDFWFMGLHNFQKTFRFLPETAQIHCRA